MAILQILGIIIPVFCLLFIIFVSSIQVANGRGNETVSAWELLLFLISIFILGFTLGTIVCLN